MSEEQKTAAVQEKPKSNDLVTLLSNMKNEFALVLPKHLTPDRLVRMAVTQFRINPALKGCDKTSFIAAVMTAAQLGLEPDGVLGHAYMVPFKSHGVTNVQLIPGYKGLLALARNSGEVSSISAHEVCEKDEFDFAFGLEEKLVHKPSRGDRGKVTHFYAIAKFKDGGHHMDVMTVEEVEALRNKSSGYKAFKAGYTKSAIWDEHFVEMGRKTAIRRIAKYLPLNVQRAAAIDSMYEAGKNAQIDKFGDFVIDAEGKEIQETKAESKPKNMDEFIAKVATPAPEPLVKEEPIIVKATPKTKPVDNDLKRWGVVRDELKAQLNRAKTTEAINDVISGDKARDLKAAQPDMFDEVQDFAMNRSQELSKKSSYTSSDFGITP
jgi:recombination protein RecT